MSAPYLIRLQIDECIFNLFAPFIVNIIIIIIVACSKCTRHTPQLSHILPRTAHTVYVNRERLQSSMKFMPN